MSVLQFPKKRKADCQGEVRVVRAAKLIDQLLAVKNGLAAGMSAAEIREVEASRCEMIIQHWTEKLADYRSPSKAAAFLCATADRLNGDVAS